MPKYGIYGTFSGKYGTKYGNYGKHGKYVKYGTGGGPVTFILILSGGGSFGEAKDAFYCLFSCLARKKRFYARRQ